MLDSVSSKAVGEEENLEDLHRDSLKALLMSASVVAFLSMCWLIQAEVLTAEGWVASALLALSILLSSRMRTRHNSVAFMVLILGMLGAATCLLWGYGAQSAA